MAAGALTNTKFFNKPGLDALRAMLMHADHYGLKWVIVRDPSYDPLLAFAGWRKVDSAERQHGGHLEQGRCAAGHASERSADTAALAGDHVGYLPVREQHSCLADSADSGEEAAGSCAGVSSGRKSCAREDGLVRKGGLLAVVLGAATVALIMIGTVKPVPAALAYAGGQGLAPSSSTPELAVRNLAAEIGLRQWGRAYGSLANKAEFSEPEFEHDLTGYYPSLRTYATLDHFDVRPLRATDNDADVRLILYWSTVVGISVSSRDLHVVRDGDHWEADWPIVKKPDLPPQVIPVNYLRWDVIYPGPGRRLGRAECGSSACPHCGHASCAARRGSRDPGRAAQRGCGARLRFGECHTAGQATAGDCHRGQLRQNLAHSAAQAGDAILHQFSPMPSCPM